MEAAPGTSVCQCTSIICCAVRVALLQNNGFVKIQPNSITFFVVVFLCIFFINVNVTVFTQYTFFGSFLFLDFGLKKITCISQTILFTLNAMTPLFAEQNKRM